MTVVRVVVLLLSALVMTLMAMGWRAVSESPPPGVCVVRGNICESVAEE